MHDKQDPFESVSAKEFLLGTTKDTVRHQNNRWRRYQAYLHAKVQDSCRGSLARPSLALSQALSAKEENQL